MARHFSELQSKLSPSRRARIEARAKEMMAEMLLAEVRREVGLSQSDLAERLGIKQPTLSKLENQDDMQISTLRRIVESLGGELELVARLPGGTIKLKQFQT